MENDLDKAVEVLKNGGVIIYPTETVYGFGADIFNQRAVEKIRELKGREFDKPISIAVEKEMIHEYAKISELAQSCIDKYLPGPLTLVLPKEKVEGKFVVPNWISSSSYIGIRVPESDFARELIEKFGPITSTSANLSGSPAPVKVSDIEQSIIEKAGLVIDQGETKYKGPSTVVKIEDKIEILRKGVLELENGS